MTTYTITVPDDTRDLSLAFLDAIEPGASGHTLGFNIDPDSHAILGVHHYRLGVYIRKSS